MSIEVVLKLLGLLIPLAMVIGVCIAAFGALEYFTTTGDEMSKTEGKNKMFLGSLTLAVFVTLWVFTVVLKEAL